jgi:hypothetical protein
MEAVSIIGSALAVLRQRQLEPRSQQLLCDADDQWIDGMLVIELMKKIRKERITHRELEVEKNTSVVRSDSSILGITRMSNGSFNEVCKCYLYYKYVIKH